MFAVIHSQTVTVARRMAAPEIDGKRFLNQIQIFDFNDANRIPTDFFLLVLIILEPKIKLFRIIPRDHRI
jgi:hypothetical protein